MYEIIAIRHINIKTFKHGNYITGKLIMKAQVIGKN